MVSATPGCWPRWPRAGCARKIPDLAQALEGHFDDHHARLARAILGRLDAVERSLAELDEAIVAACEPWAHEIELLTPFPE